jgi:hypothetical protein
MKLGDLALLAAVLVALVTSLYLWLSGQRDEGLFVGLWIPSILAGAIYAKLATSAR